MEKNTKRKYRLAVGVIACFVIVFFAGLGFSVKDTTYDEQSRVSKSLVTEQPKVEIPKLYNTEQKTTAEKQLAQKTEVEEIPEEFPDAQEVFVPKEPERFIFPVKGAVTMQYSETPVYSRTLEDWRSHNGIDLAASEGEEVFAAAAGVVEDAYFDTFYGYTVTINHTGGTKTIYSNLSGDVTVAPGKTVSEGELIGYAGSTASCESEEDAHIHFEMKRENKYLNPAEYLEKK